MEKDYIVLSENIPAPTPPIPICQLLNTTPDQLVAEFMDNIAQVNWRQHERRQARAQLVEYIIAMGYGRPQLTPADMRELFARLDAISSLFPTDAPDDLFDLHCKWRDEYEKWWLEKWS